MAASIAAVPDWGWWHARSHASVHVAVNDVALGTPRLRWAAIKSGPLVLRDNNSAKYANPGP